MNLAASWTPPETAPGWAATLALTYARRGERTALVRRHQHGPLTVQRPFYPEGDAVCHTYLLHPPAGIVGGDRLTLDCELGTGSQALITTPGATRWYFSHARTAGLLQEIRVAAGAQLEWLPQETLVFDGAHAELRTRIALAGDARVIGCEILGLGRPAAGERFRHGVLDTWFEILRDGIPLFLDRLRSGPGGVAGLRGNTATATLFASGADEAALLAARSVIDSAPHTLAGASLLGDLLICRALAPHCEPLIDLNRALWSRLRPLLLGRAATAPRIWRT
ncbi:MAG: urease accessory protein UreD [Gammaproteobacteria bacterium]